MALRRLPPVRKSLRRRLGTPLAQTYAAGTVMFGGAALIGAWMVGVVLMVMGLLLGADAVLRDTGRRQQWTRERRPPETVEDVFEKYRQAQ